MINFKPKPEHVFFVLICVLYWSAKLLTKNHDVPEFVTSWFSDFLAIPFIMFFFRIFLGFFENAYSNKALPIYFIATAVIVYAVWFEYYLPKEDPIRYIGDWVDALAYVFGGVVFWIFEKWRFKSSK